MLLCLTLQGFGEFRCRLSYLHGECFTNWALIPAPDLLPFFVSLQSNVKLDNRWACVRAGDQERDSGNWARIKRVGVRHWSPSHYGGRGTTSCWWVRERERAGSDLSWPYCWALAFSKERPWTVASRLTLFPEWGLANYWKLKCNSMSNLSSLEAAARSQTAFAWDQSKHTQQEWSVGDVENCQPLLMILYRQENLSGTGSSRDTCN